MKSVKVSVMALCAMCMLASCNSKNATEQSSDAMIVEEVQPRVKLASVAVQDVDQLQVYAATVVSDIKNNIAPAAPSRIEKILVEVGDNVTKGQKLVQMDESSLKQLRLQISNMEVVHNLSRHNSYCFSKGNRHYGVICTLCPFRCIPYVH